VRRRETMAVELRDSAGKWILRLSGVVGVNDASMLHAAAREAAQGASRAVVVDLQEVDRLDTSATQILLSLRRHLAAGGRALRVEGTPPAVAELWRRAGLLELIDGPVSDHLLPNATTRRVG
jgi:anti-anti-sigma factor